MTTMTTYKDIEASKAFAASYITIPTSTKRVTTSHQNTSFIIYFYMLKNDLSPVTIDRIYHHVTSQKQCQKFFTIHFYPKTHATYCLCEEHSNEAISVIVRKIACARKRSLRRYIPRDDVLQERNYTVPRKFLL